MIEQDELGAFTVANLADACVALGVPVGLLPTLRPAISNCSFVGLALPVRHFGSVDVFLQAIDLANPGDVLVVDNQGRNDEGCLGDLITLEAVGAGIAAIVIWGRHRDSEEIDRIRLPLFSLGACPAGPRHARTADDPFPSALSIGGTVVTRGAVVAGDRDGLIIFSAAQFPACAERAADIAQREGRQAAATTAGIPLRQQLAFPEYLEARRHGSKLTFREHVALRQGAIET